MFADKLLIWTSLKRFKDYFTFSKTMTFTLLKCTVVNIKWFFSIFTKLYNDHHYVVPEHFCLPQISSHSPFLPSPSPWQPLSTFCCCEFPYSHKWNPAVWLFCTRHLSLGHPCCSMYEYLIAFYGQIIFHCVGIPHFN